MGAVFRKPVSADNWDSLYSEAQRLLESSSLLLQTGSQQQMRDVMAQAKMIARMCQAYLHGLSQSRHQHPLLHQRAEWLRDWYSQMEENYNSFQAQRRLRLEGIQELEERLLD